MAVDVKRTAVATGLVLAYGAASQRAIPRSAQLPANLGAATGLVLLARRWGASWEELGLDARSAPAGIAVGAATVPPIALAIATGTAIPPLRELFHDDRVAGTSWRDAALHVLVRVPLATALAEELLFRSALFAIAGARHDRTRAVAFTSLAFGIWHVLPALHSHRSNPGAAKAAEPVGGAAAVIGGTVAATSLAGVGFAWLRLRSRSVLAPVIAHAALNSAAFLASRRVARARRAASGG